MSNIIKVIFPGASVWYRCGTGQVLWTTRPTFAGMFLESRWLQWMNRIFLMFILEVHRGSHCIKGIIWVGSHWFSKLPPHFLNICTALLYSVGASIATILLKRFCPHLLGSVRWQQFLMDHDVSILIWILHGIEGM